MRVVVWANFDVDYDIALPERWIKVNSPVGPAIIRVKHAVGIQEKRRSMELKFEPKNAREFAVTKQPSDSFKKLTSAKIPEVKYYAEAVLADGSTVPHIELSFGAETTESIRLPYTQVDLLFSYKIPGGDWRKGNWMREASITIFNFFIVHYRCLSSDFRAVPLNAYDEAYMRFWVLIPEARQKTSTCDHLLSFTEQHHKFQGMTSHPMRPIMSLTWPPYMVA